MRQVSGGILPLYYEIIKSIYKMQRGSQEKGCEIQGWQYGQNLNANKIIAINTITILAVCLLFSDAKVAMQ